MRQSFYSYMYFLHIEGQWGDPRRALDWSKKMTTEWKGVFHEKEYRIMNDFIPNKECLGVLGEGESMGTKRRSLDEVVSPCHHL